MASEWMSSTLYQKTKDFQTTSPMKVELLVYLELNIGQMDHGCMRFVHSSHENQFVVSDDGKYQYLQGLGKILKEYDAFSVGEMPCVRDEKEILKAVGADRGELAMIFHFEMYTLATFSYPAEFEACKNSCIYTDIYLVSTWIMATKGNTLPANGHSPTSNVSLTNGNAS